MCLTTGELLVSRLETSPCTDLSRNQKKRRWIDKILWFIFCVVQWWKRAFSHSSYFVELWEFIKKRTRFFFGKCQLIIVLWQVWMEGTSRCTKREYYGTWEHPSILISMTYLASRYYNQGPVEGSLGTGGASKESEKGGSSIANIASTYYCNQRRAEGYGGIWKCKSWTARKKALLGFWSVQRHVDQPLLIMYLHR